MPTPSDRATAAAQRIATAAAELSEANAAARVLAEEFDAEQQFALRSKLLDLLGWHAGFDFTNGHGATVREVIYRTRREFGVPDPIGYPQEWR